MLKIVEAIREVAVAMLLMVVCATPVLATEANDYKLGTGDLVRISVFNNPDLSSDARVSQSGNITYPLLGQVPVNGLSTRELEMLLTRRLGEGGFLAGAQVSALVVEYQSQKVSVMGQVAKPGQYALTQANKVLDALAAAGGTITATAADQATLLRQGGTQQPIDLIKLFEGDPTQNPSVAAGDTLFIPKAPQFYIYGEVQHPGVYKVEHGMTVLRAISASGGLTARGSEHRVILKRKDANGTERKLSLSGSDALQGDDVVFVRESLF